jgi:hypothetical protein
MGTIRAIRGSLDDASAAKIQEVGLGWWTRQQVQDILADEWLVTRYRRQTLFNIWVLATSVPTKRTERFQQVRGKLLISTRMMYGLRATSLDEFAAMGLLAIDRGVPPERMMGFVQAFYGR